MTQQVEEAAGPAPSQTAPPLVDAQGVKKHFAVGRGVFSYGKQTVKAVDGVDFEITEGETFCLAGESGCGKTTLANLLLKLERPTDGMLRWQGAEIDRLTREETRAYRRNVQAVFQDPWSSLNSKLRVGTHHRRTSGDQPAPLETRNQRQGGVATRAGDAVPGPRRTLPA